MNCLIYNYIYI